MSKARIIADYAGELTNVTWPTKSE